MFVYFLFLSTNRVCYLRGRNEQLKAQEASFREAREKLLEDLDKRVKAAKRALAAASTALKKEQRLSQVYYAYRALLELSYLVVRASYVKNIYIYILGVSSKTARR